MEGIDRISALKPSAESTFDVGAWRERCFTAMNDDFNTPVLIAHLFEAVGEINKAYDGKAGFTADDIALLRQTFEGFVYQVMGIENIDRAGDQGLTDPLIGLFIEERNAARAARDWALSDRIRDRLAALGIALKDGKDGTTYSIER